MAEQMAGAQIDRLVETAKRYPRSLTRFRENAITLATIDEETAASCSYAIPRDGKTIVGPSVRFAEIIASTYQNLWAQVTPVGEDARFVTVRAVAWDVENNLCLSFDVRRRITKSNGQRYKDDMIGVTTGAASSIAFRNAVLRVVPEATTRHILEAAQKVVRGEETTIGVRLDKMLAYFASMGVDAARVFAAVQVDGRSDIGLDELLTLRSMATAIKAEGASIDQLFPVIERVVPAGSRADQLAEQIRAKAGGTPPQATAQGAPADGAPTPAPTPQAGTSGPSDPPTPAPTPTTGPDQPPDEFLASMGDPDARLTKRLEAARQTKGRPPAR